MPTSWLGVVLAGGAAGRKHRGLLWQRCIAAYFGKEAALKVLLEHGVDADKKDDDGRSPLDRAKKNNHAGCVALLERHGAN